MNRSTEHSMSALEAQEARLGLRLAASLNSPALKVSHDISERLRVSRDQAVSRARELRLAQAAVVPSIVGRTRAGAAVFGQPHQLWLQLASWAPLAVLIAGLVLIQQWSDREQVLAAAEIDAVLLADDLPPDAFVDPGFREYLKAPQP